jgi:predicted dehydrogenase
MAHRNILKSTGEPSAGARRTSRRKFLEQSAALGIGAAAFSQTARVHAAGSDLLRVGLVGCGGRGSGAAAQALQADKNVKLVAMADAFEDRVEASLASLKKQEAVAAKIDVPPERRFAGFDAYKQLMASGVDVVLLCEPPHFRPSHLKAAIDAGLHVFAEKPVAVDAPGVRSVLKSCEEAKAKNLSVVSGLCLRFCYGFQETAKRIHDGQIGEVLSLEANDYRGGGWGKPRKPEWTDMHYQMRNWYYYTWLSGDFNVEQHVHFLDICAWAMKNEYPVKAYGLGGRQVRNTPECGNIYDHHSVTYEYANGAKLYSNCRQIAGCYNNMSANATGPKGRAYFSESRGGLKIVGQQPWSYSGPENPFYQTEHDELFASVRSGKPINNGEYMARSTLLAIMGRMATYTGKTITWEQAMASKEDLTPPKYEWGPLPVAPVAMPGVTKFL